MALRLNAMVSRFRMPLRSAVWSQMRSFSTPAAGPFTSIGEDADLGQAKLKKGMCDPNLTYRLHISVTPNNTLYSVCDQNGDAKIVTTNGAAGFKGTQKASLVANSHCGELLGKKMMAKGIREVECYLKGYGAGRKAAVKGVLKAGISIVSYTERTPIPHGGTKRKKTRRL